MAGCQKGHNTHRAGHLIKTEQTNTRNAISLYIYKYQSNTAQTDKKTERLTTAFLGERIKLWFNHGDHGGLTFSQMHRQIEGNSSIVF